LEIVFGAVRGRFVGISNLLLLAIGPWCDEVFHLVNVKLAGFSPSPSKRIDTAIAAVNSDPVYVFARRAQNHRSNFLKAMSSPGLKKIELFKWIPHQPILYGRD